MKSDPSDVLPLAEQLFTKYCLVISGERTMDDIKVSEIADIAIHHAIIFFEAWEDKWMHGSR
jgi:hypothetical protein